MSLFVQLMLRYIVSVESLPMIPLYRLLTLQIVLRRPIWTRDSALAWITAWHCRYWVCLHHTSNIVLFRHNWFRHNLADSITLYSDHSSRDAFKPLKTRVCSFLWTYCIVSVHELTMTHELGHNFGSYHDLVAACLPSGFLKVLMGFSVYLL